MVERRFIRHPASIPLTVTPVIADSPMAASETRNIGAGGLAFVSSQDFTVGSTLHLCIPQLRQPFEADARVLWCRRSPDGMETGVEFLSRDEAYRARMIEQVCHIEAYRRQVLQEEGRALDDNSAAREWVLRYAADFPSGDSPQDSID